MPSPSVTKSDQKVIRGDGFRALHSSYYDGRARQLLKPSPMMRRPQRLTSSFPFKPPLPLQKPHNNLPLSILPLCRSLSLSLGYPQSTKCPPQPRLISPTLVSFEAPSTKDVKWPSSRTCPMQPCPNVGALPSKRTDGLEFAMQLNRGIVHISHFFICIFRH